MDGGAVQRWICAGIPPSIGGEWSLMSAPKALIMWRQSLSSPLHGHSHGISALRGLLCDQDGVKQQWGRGKARSLDNLPESHQAGSHPDDAHSAITRESSSRWSEAHFLAM